MRILAEREGFEPPIGLHLCRISSAVHSTTLPPLQVSMTERSAPWSGRVLGEDGWPDKALGLRNSRLHLGCLERVGPPDAEKNRRSRVASLKLRTGSAA